MQDLEERIIKAQKDKEELEKLLRDYMPFIKKQASLYDYLSIEYEDRVSISMLTFMNCTKQYDSGKGTFLSYAALVMKSRLIDEDRKNNRKVISIQEEERLKEEETASILHYRFDLENNNLRLEMECLERQLKDYGISFTGLCSVSPKQKRSRMQCMNMARQLITNDSLRKEFEIKNRIPQNELAKACGISIKTVEKYRKYIITLVVLMIGDYGAIRTFLPRMEEV